MTTLLRIHEVAARYAVSEKTIRRKLIARDGSIAAPAFDHPWRWRAADVERHIATSSVTDLQRTRARRLRVA